MSSTVARRHPSRGDVLLLLLLVMMMEVVVVMMMVMMTAITLIEETLELVTDRFVCRVAWLLGHVDADVRNDHVVDLFQLVGVTVGSR